jgi:hypothetical protein
VEKAPPGNAGQVVELAIPYLAQATKSPLSLTDDAVLYAQSAATASLGARRTLRQIEEASRDSVSDGGDF